MLITLTDSDIKCAQSQIIFQVALSCVLLTALAEPLVGDPLGADEDRAARVHGGFVAGAVPEQLG